jgi:hypothetical protein
MTSEQIRQALRAEPFRPFELKTTGGRRYPVGHPEAAILSPSGRTLALTVSDDSFVVLDVRMVESLNFIAGNGRSKRRRSA